jgi:hypothetical protein
VIGEEQAQPARRHARLGGEREAALRIEPEARAGQHEAQPDARVRGMATAQGRPVPLPQRIAHQRIGRGARVRGAEGVRSHERTHAGEQRVQQHAFEGEGQEAGRRGHGTNRWRVRAIVRPRGAGTAARDAR